MRWSAFRTRFASEPSNTDSRENNGGTVFLLSSILSGVLGGQGLLHAPWLLPGSRRMPEPQADRECPQSSAHLPRDQFRSGTTSEDSIPRVVEPQCNSTRA